ncbi:hypothetical protein CDAR_620871 [Caerostris darwini]|uniref:Uncharacterized protein n=1 Tax=Caerostris darwini TaxID=1538125 RepID=A0AAV4URZ3_9ARAC|nr:hypothetical protein CDAR_620871 [Caerostris darwini]
MCAGGDRVLRREGESFFPDQWGWGPRGKPCSILLSGSLKATLVSSDVSFFVAVKDASEAEPSFIGNPLTALHLATKNCLMFRNIVKDASENKWILASTFSVMNVLNRRIHDTEVTNEDAIP